jgi:hypothetical protein
VRFRRDRQPPASAAESLRPLLFGDRSLDQWPPPETIADAEPWASFVRARELEHTGRHDEAIDVWRQIASEPEIESRHILQAWHFLRAAGLTPPPDTATIVLGAVAEVAPPDGHDLLVAYRDGGVRYLNWSGKVAVVDGTDAQALDSIVTAWLDLAGSLATVVGVWDQAQLPTLPPGHSRIMMLTPAGLRFGQGPDDLLRQDAPAAAFLEAATRVLVAVTNLT